MNSSLPAAPLPVLLFNDECAVCRSIAGWVKRSGGDKQLLARPIGDDPERLRKLNPALDIWSAYETLHLLMPDGSMKLGGEAVAEVLRSLPNTQWFARIFAFRIFGSRPFQKLLDGAYFLLSEIRPLFGCESCGAPTFWSKPIHWFGKVLGRHTPSEGRPHFTSRAAETHLTAARVST